MCDLAARIFAYTHTH